MTQLIIKLKLVTDRDPRKVEEFIVKSASQAGQVIQATTTTIDQEQLVTNAEKVRRALVDLDGTPVSQVELSNLCELKVPAISRALHKLRSMIEVDIRKGSNVYYIKKLR